MSGLRQEGARRYCLANKTDGSGDLCANTAGFKTVHPGYGRCHLHAGNTANLVLSAAREQAQEIASSSTDIDVSPDDALISSIGRSWGVVHWCAARISQIEDSAAALNANTDLEPSQRVIEEARLSKLLLTFNKLYGQWIDRSAGLSKLALDLGLDERRVQVEEQKLDVVVELIKAVFDSAEVGMSSEQRKAADQVLFKELSAARDHGQD